MQSMGNERLTAFVTYPDRMNQDVLTLLRIRLPFFRLHAFFHGHGRGSAFHGLYLILGKGGAGPLAGIAAIKAIGAYTGVIPFGMNHKTIAVGATAAHREHLIYQKIGISIPRMGQTVNIAQIQGGIFAFCPKLPYNNREKQMGSGGEHGRNFVFYGV